MILSQKTYIQRMLERFGMENCIPIKTPIEIKPPDRNPVLPIITSKKPYRELVGCLMHLMLATRPDLCFSVAFHSRFQSNASESGWKSLKRVLRYLQGTKDYGLFFPKNCETQISAFADADWGNSQERKSTSGFVVKVFGATVSWASRKQRITALSSTEAEFIALASATCEVMWLKTLLSEMEINSQVPTIYEDNQSCIHHCLKWDSKRLKHVDIKYNFVKDLVQTKRIDLKYVSSENQIADIMTKGLCNNKFCNFRNLLCICKIEAEC